MKREDLRAIEGLTDAQVDAVMALAGRDSTAAHAREDALQQQLTAAQQGLAAFGTQKPSDLATALQQVQQLQTQLNEQAADYRFRTFARNAAQDAGAIDAEDVVNLLAQDAALKGSDNMDADIRAAVEKMKSQTKPHWFNKAPNTNPQPEGQGGRLCDDGLHGPHGAQGQEPDAFCRPVRQEPGGSKTHFLRRITYAYWHLWRLPV